MRTLADVERRSDEIKARINQILTLIREDAPGAEPGMVAGLAEEMALLLHESKILAVSMALARDMSQVLANSECSGPH